MEELNSFLEKTSSEKLNTPELASLLAKVWDQFSGGGVASMAARKLLGRMEDVIWVPPILSFTVERHGSTVLGSSRAELQFWEVNVKARTAEIIRQGQRQLEKMAPRLDVTAIATLAFDDILARKQRPYLSWKSPAEVHVNMSCLFPVSGAKAQTLRGRRKRCQEQLAAALQNSGWSHIGSNIFQKKGC
jgi:hypothetical protein